jgi:hypothetical protein
MLDTGRKRGAIPEDERGIILAICAAQGLKVEDWESFADAFGTITGWVLSPMNLAEALADTELSRELKDDNFDYESQRDDDELERPGGLPQPQH